MALDRLFFDRPADQYLYVEREPVDAQCPQCDSHDVKRYPIVSSLGPRIVVKCQDCFFVLRSSRPAEEDNWFPFRPATSEWPASPAEGGKHTASNS